MSVDPARKALRHRLRECRRALPAAQRIAAAEALADRLLQLPMFPSDGHLGGYWAMDGEIGLHAFQLRLPPEPVYCLPILHGNTLRFAPWRPGDPLVTNRYGIPEPDVSASSALPASAMAMLVLPLVAFDSRCNRLGMGGGWYDRTLEFRLRNAGPPLLVGAAFTLQQVDTLATGPWDVRLDVVCTEAETFHARTDA